MEVICNLYKTSGKWYGEHTFMYEGSYKGDFPDNSLIEYECGKSYTFPQNYVIHIQIGNQSRIILPK
jgi:hypothetical protein